MCQLGRTRSAGVAAVFGMVALLAAAACGNSDAGSSDSNWGVGGSSDAGSDAGRPDADVEPPDEPLYTTFRIENTGSERVWVKPPKFECRGRGNSPGWMTLREDGESRAALDSCDVCNCDSLEENEGCAVCSGAPCVGGDSNDLPPGGSLEWTWKGQFYRRDTVDGRICERPYIPDDGASLSAEFCWNPDPDKAAESVECDTISFDYGRQEVTKAIEPVSDDSSPVATTFRLENETDHGLQVTKPSACMTGEKPWVALYDGETEVDFEDDCTRCSCDDVQSGRCGACRKACGPTTARVAAGESIEMMWNGEGQRLESVDGQTCHEPWVPRRGEELTARFCFDIDDPTLDEGKRCVEAPVVYGEESPVTYTVE